MRRYLWIIVSLVLPVAFLVVMKTRPPVPPGEEAVERLMPGESRAPLGVFPEAAEPDQDAGVPGAE